MSSLLHQPPTQPKFPNLWSWGFQQPLHSLPRQQKEPGGLGAGQRRVGLEADPPSPYLLTKRQLSTGEAALSFLNWGSYPLATPRTECYYGEAHLALAAGAPHLQVPQKLGRVCLRLNGFILTDGQEQGLQAGGGVHQEPPRDRQGITTTRPLWVSSFHRAFFDFFGPTPSRPETSGSGLAPEVSRTEWCGGGGGEGDGRHGNRGCEVKALEDSVKWVRSCPVGHFI